ncbi:MAG: O-antigen ligase family protein, partial [Anaerolineae bacterium]|nr:O-antigen ligase family protein [Anaerolineae bacterium]
MIATRIGRYGFILAATYFALVGGTYYYQIFAVRAFQHLFVTVVLGAWLALRLARRRGLPPTPLNPLLYLGVVVWCASALVSLDPRMALENLWLPLTNLGFFFIIVDQLQRGRESRVVETQFLLAALVVILAGAQLGSWFFGWGFATPTVGWISVLGGDIPFPLASPRLFVPLGVSTWLAAYSAPLAVVAFAWGFSVQQRAARLAFWLLAALLAIIMLLTNSRGGWISLGAGLGVFALLQVAHSQRLRQIVRRFIVPIALGIVALVTVAALVLARLSADPGHTAGDVLRFDLWRGALDIAAGHPVLGVGPGEFGRAYRLYRDPTYVDNRLGTAHNVYLNTLAETGIAGALVALGLGALLLRSWWRLWRSAETPTRRRHLEGALAGLVGFGAHSFFDTFTIVPLALLALGLTAYCVTTTRQRSDPPLVGSRAAAIVGLILIVGYGAGLALSDQAQAIISTSVTERSLDAARQAEALDPSLRLYALQVAYLTEGDAAIPAYEHALVLEPTWDTGWINLAALYARQGATAQALDALQTAINLDNRSGALLMWARLAENENAAPPEAIVDAYRRHLGTYDPGDLPLSTFWWATDLRRQALEAYADRIALDLRYRIFAALDPQRLAALVPAAPASAGEWWVVGEHALTVAGDARAADAAFTQAIARLGDPTYRGDYYASRARARLSFDSDAAQRDLNVAALLGTYNESVNAIRAELSTSVDEQRRLWAAAVPLRVIEANFEGVLFGGRVASFDVLPEMRLPGPGRS